MSRVQSIERAFAVLGALSAGPIGVTEVAERVSLPKSTAARLLRSLQREGAVEQVPGDSRYRLGPRVVTLAASASTEGSLVVVARRFLEELAVAVGEAAGLAVPDGWDVRYVDQASVDHEVQVRDWTGTRAPMYSVPSGRVLLAALPSAELERYLAGPFEALTPHTVTESGVLRERILRARMDGFAWGHEEFVEGISSVAAAIAGPGGEVVGAIHVHGPAYRFPTPGSEERLARQVVAVAARISARLRRTSA